MTQPIPSVEVTLRSRLDIWDSLAGSGVALAGAVVVVAGAFITSSTEWVSQLCLVGVIIGTVVLIILGFLTFLRAKNREVEAINAARLKEIEARAIAVNAQTNTQVEIGSAINAMITSILKGLADLKDATPRDAIAYRRNLRDTVQQLAVNIAPQIVGPEGQTRSYYFDFQAGPPKRLVATHWGGARVWSREPKIGPFVENTIHGDYVINKVEENQTEFYRDLKENQPDGFDISKLEYRTFISVPVASALGDMNTAYGLLSVDAPEPGQLVVTDLALMSVMAGLVTIAMAVTREPETPAPVKLSWTPAVNPSLAGLGRHRLVEATPVGAQG
jgi:hypothetical protein